MRSCADGGNADGSRQVVGSGQAEIQPGCYQHVVLVPNAKRGRVASHTTRRALSEPGHIVSSQSLIPPPSDEG
jgi:hypothetical protein